MKLELNHKEKFGRNSNTWKLKTTLLKNAWINQEIKELKQFIETNENEDTSVHNFWDKAKVVIRGKYVAIQASLKKMEKSRIYQLSLHHKELENRQQIKLTPHTRREIIKVRAETNGIGTRDTVERINETRSWFFERINKTNKTLAKLI